MVSDMHRPRLYRGLRIAMSAVFGGFCLLLIALWVRSSWRNDVARGPGIRSTFFVQSVQGKLVSGTTITSRAVGRWEIHSFGVRGREAFREAMDRLDIFGFAFNIYSGRGFYLQLPHWSVLLMFAGLATAPWLRCSFALRT